MLIKNININPTRVGILKILTKMNADIKIINKRIYKGEDIVDIKVKVPNILNRLIVRKFKHFSH